MDYKPFLSLIEKYDTITIFRHSNPDGDAVGSQLGLLNFIKDNYNDKKVYALGREVFDCFPYRDEVDDNTIKSSLAIVLDTANRERIDDDRWILAKEIVKIDHHPIVDSYAHLNYESPSAAATCELLADILTSDVFKHLKITKKTAEYLYIGLITDTISFSTSNTSANTLKCASFLLSTGIVPYDICRTLFKKDYRIYRYCSYIRSKVEFDNGLAIAKINQKELNEYNISAKEGRNFVSELGNVKEFKIWCLFTENEKGLYDGSLRSDKEYIINEIASKYHGGGHANASGVKELTLEDLANLKLDLLNLLNN